MLAALPRLPRHQVLGDHARLAGPAFPQVRVGQLRLGLYIVASRPPSTQTSTSFISAGMWNGTRVT